MSNTKSNKTRIRVPLDNGTYLITDVNIADKNIPPEICTYIEDKDGSIIQDIAIIRQNYEYDNRNHINLTKDINVLVWADEQDEDYTDDFVIPMLKETTTETFDFTKKD